MKKIVLLFIVASQFAVAADVDYAYYGMGSAIQYGCYGVTKDALHLQVEEKWQARLFCSIFTTSVIAFTAARDESAKKGNVLGYGLAGVASAKLVSYSFDF